MSLGVVIFGLAILYQLPASNAEPELNIDGFETYLSEYLGESFGQYIRMLEDVNFSDNSTTEVSPICSACQAGTALVLLNQARNVTYDDVRNATILSCVVLLGNRMRGDVMCPGLMDNYYTAVNTSLALKPTTISEYCLALRFCDHYEIPDENRNHHHQPASLKRTSMREYYDAKAVESRRVYREVVESRKNADLIKVVQLTDIHIDHKYVTGAATDCGMYICCREGRGFEGNGTAGLWGNYACNTPKRTVELVLRDIMQNKQPDIVLYTGDTPPHAMWEETQEIQMNYTEYLTSMFRESLPNINVYPTMGNHDVFPTNLYWREVGDILEANHLWYEWWEELADLGEVQKMTIEQGAYFSVNSLNGLTIISYNSLFAYAQNFYCLLNEDDEQYYVMMQYIEAVLEEVQLEGGQAIMIGHIPPGMYAIDSFNDWLHDMMVRYSDVIKMHVYGHTHRDHYVLFNDDRGDARSMFFVAPSVTAKTDRNPTLRVYWLDPETYDLLDYDHYYINMTAEYRDESLPVIEHAYSALEEYDLMDMSASAWQNLAERFEVDDDLFQRYYFHHTTRNGLVEYCDVDCKRDMICEILYFDFEEMIDCKKGDV